MDLPIEQLIAGYALKVFLGLLLAGLVFVFIVVLHYRMRLKKSPQAPYLINKALAGSFGQVACGHVGPLNAASSNASHHLKECLRMVEDGNGSYSLVERGNLSQESVNKILLRSEY